MATSFERRTPFSAVWQSPSCGKITQTRKCFSRFRSLSRCRACRRLLLLLQVSSIGCSSLFCIFSCKSAKSLRLHKTFYRLYLMNRTPNVRFAKKSPSFISLKNVIYGVCLPVFLHFSYVLSFPLTY